MATTKFSKYQKKERLVTVYGMINICNDGHKVIVAQKLEKSSGSKNWDINKLVWNNTLNEFGYTLIKEINRNINYKNDLNLI